MFASSAGRIAIASPAHFSVVATVATWVRRSSQRRQLTGLTADILKDIGLDPAEASIEAAKPFWIA